MSDSTTPQSDSTSEEGGQPDEPEDSHVIRDFIYLDVERLNSIYAQVFGGTVREMTERLVRQSPTRSTNPDAPNQEVGLTKALHESERKVLHDHMYNDLEAELGQSIREAPQLSAVPVEEEIPGTDALNPHEGQNAFENQNLLKVTGYPALLDYKEIREYAEKWSKFDDAFSKTNESYAAAKEAERLREKIRTANKSERDAIVRQIRELDAIAGSLGENFQELDPAFLEFMILMLDMVYGDALDIIINREDDHPFMSFRATLNRQWMRLTHRRIKLLYGSSLPTMEWSMVGHLTYNPLAKERARKSREAFSNTDPEVGELEGNFRDAIRQMASQFSNFEAETLRSRDSLEFHLMPLAIYRTTRMQGFNEDLVDNTENGGE